MATVARSYLYVPGDQPDKLARAASRGADALLVDLEDAVLPARKGAARDTTRAWLESTFGSAGLPELWVRLNADAVEEDLAAVVLPGLTGVVVPKAEPALLRRVDEALRAVEREVGLVEGVTRLIPMVETALGVLRAEEVAAAPRVLRLGIGEADLAGALGLRPGPQREELWHIRSVLVLASASGGLLSPVGPVELALDDPDLLEETTQLLLRQGFRARTVLAPRQLDVVHRVFTPSADEVREAHRVLRLLEASAAQGSGVAVDADGRFIDAATVRSAREVLARAR
jgi:citrate lyase subunit beta/citryl-CoA lyase